MAITSSQYAIQKVFTIRGYDILTGELKLELKKLKESKFTNGQTTVFVTGGQANAQQASFDHSKTAMISGSSATIDENLVALQVGTDVAELTNTTAIEFTEVLTVASDAANTLYTATGTVGAELKYAYILNTDGSIKETLTQDASVAAGKFTYTAGTKKVTLNTGDYDDGVKVKVVYYPTAATAKRITNTTTDFSATVKLVADALLKDVCTDQIVRGQIVADKGHIMGQFEWSLGSASDPAVHSFEASFLESCGTEKLWDFYIFDTADLT